MKKVKEVVQDSFNLAYHLILEASFLADRQTMFSTIFPKQATLCVMETEKVPLSPPGKSSFETIDIPFSNGFDDIQINGESDGEKAENWDSGGDHVFSHEPYNPVIFTGFSSLSAKLSKYFGLVENPESVPVTMDTDANSSHTEDATEKDERPLLLDPGLPVNTNSDDGERSPAENDIETTLESQSILVLVSKRNASKGMMCDQSHFSHIKFYKHFDVRLDRFLRDMFSQVLLLFFVNFFFKCCFVLLSRLICVPYVLISSKLNGFTTFMASFFKATVYGAEKPVPNVR